MTSLHGVICVGLGFRVDAQFKRAQVWLPLTADGYNFRQNHLGSIMTSLSMEVHLARDGCEAARGRVMMPGFLLCFNALSPDGGTRTPSQPLWRRPLFQLSYVRMFPNILPG